MRVADALIPMSMLYGWPVVVGVTLGCVVSNMFSPMPSILVDITLGSLANLVASVLAWKILSWRRNEFLGCSIATATLTFIVGTYLAKITGIPYRVWWFSIFIGSVISINVLGYVLILILKKIGNLKHAV